jgi:hypothetical protein
VRERLASARVPVRSPASSGSGLMPATDLGASGEDGVVDEVRRGATILRVWSTGLNVSSSFDEKRPERLQATARFGRGYSRRFPAK